MFHLIIVSSLHSNYSQGPLQTAFLHKHNISIFNIKNLITSCYLRPQAKDASTLAEAVAEAVCNGYPHQVLL